MHDHVMGKKTIRRVEGRRMEHAMVGVCCAEPYGGGELPGCTFGPYFNNGDRVGGGGVVERVGVHLFRAIWCKACLGGACMVDCKIVSVDGVIVCLQIWL